ncbi:MAG: hypothetical protein ABI675_17955 [Chitinophagaceae bacterium]
MTGLRGQNIPSNSKAIDKTISDNCIVSHKSTDLRKISYQSAKTVYRLGMCFVTALRNYSGEVRRDHKIGATYHLNWTTENPECIRILEWFIPDFEIPDECMKTLQRIINEGRSFGILVSIFKVRDY